MPREAKDKRPDPRLDEFIERLAELLAADYLRSLPAEKQPRPPPEDDAQ